MSLYKNLTKIKNMEVNNLEKIKTMLQFRTSDDFYFLQIIKRRKENPNLGRNSVTIRNYYVHSVEHLEKIFPEVVVLSKVTNARACINLNRKSFIDVGHDTNILVAKHIKEKKFDKIFSAYDKACGATNNEKPKKWIIDIDVKDLDFVNFLIEEINKIPPIGDKVLGTLPTKNGYHLITTGFDLRVLDRDINWESLKTKGWEKPDIQKNNPTILYIPNIN